MDHNAKMSHMVPVSRHVDWGSGLGPRAIVEVDWPGGLAIFCAMPSLASTCRQLTTLRPTGHRITPHKKRPQDAEGREPTQSGAFGGRENFIPGRSFKFKVEKFKVGIHKP